jgi:hypothetical protein
MGDREKLAIIETKKRGRNYIISGISIIGVYLLSLPIMPASHEMLQYKAYLFLGVFTTGIGLIVKGIHHLKKNSNHKYEVSKELYGVEEPDKEWNCPKCGANNSNLTYTCSNCSYSLI